MLEGRPGRGSASFPIQRDILPHFPPNKMDPEPQIANHNIYIYIYAKTSFVVFLKLWNQKIDNS